jgi:hypothetical protein
MWTTRCNPLTPPSRVYSLPPPMCHLLNSPRDMVSLHPRELSNNRKIFWSYQYFSFELYSRNLHRVLVEFVKKTTAFSNGASSRKKGLKRQCHRIFDLWFFSSTIPSRSLIHALKYFRIALRIRQEINVYRYMFCPALCGIALNHGSALCHIALDFFSQNLYKDEYVWPWACRIAPDHGPALCHIARDKIA